MNEDGWHLMSVKPKVHERLRCYTVISPLPPPLLSPPLCSPHSDPSSHLLSCPLPPTLPSHPLPFRPLPFYPSPPVTSPPLPSSSLLSLPSCPLTSHSPLPSLCLFSLPLPYSPLPPRRSLIFPSSPLLASPLSSSYTCHIL